MSPRIRRFLVVLIAVATVAFFWLKVDDLTDTAVRNQHAATVNEQRLETAEQQVAALAEQLRAVGERPVVQPGDVPEPVPGPPGEPGTVGPPGRAPSPTEIAAAVRAYCAEGRCDGRSATPTQVRAAVLRYCDARGRCRGPAGAQGTQGPRGAPPDDEQVAQAVAAYCAERDGCRGPRGEPGTPGAEGPRGEQGPGGRSAYPFTFTFTVEQNPARSTTYTVACRAADEPCTVTSSEE